MLSSRIAIPSQPPQRAAPARFVASGLALIVLAKIGLSLGVFPLVLGAMGDNYNAGNFPDHYDGLAENLVAGNGYRVRAETGPSMLREPGWPLVLAVLFTLFGKNLFAVQALNVAMSLASSFLTYDLGKRLLRSPVIGALAAAVVLLHPAVLVAESRGGVECFTMLLYTLCVWLAIRAFERRRLTDYVILGAAFGAALLTRSSVVLLVPGLFAVYLLAKRYRATNLRAPLGRMLVTGVCAALMLSPWIVRNFNVSGQFVPTMTTSGLAIFQGVYVVKHQASGERVMDVLNRAAAEQLRIADELNLRHVAGYFPLFYSARDEVDFYRELGSRGLKAYQQSPELLLASLAHNSLAFWIQGRTPKATLLNVLVTTPFLLLAIAGAWLVRRELFAVGTLGIGVLALLVPHLFVIGLARYHMPIVPMLALLAAVALATAWHRRTQARETVLVGTPK